MCVGAQSCPTLCRPKDCSLPGSFVDEISQARIVEWVAISSTRGSSWPRDQTLISCISCIGRWILYHCATWEVLYSYQFSSVHFSRSVVSDSLRPHESQHIRPPSCPSPTPTVLYLLLILCLKGLRFCNSVVMKYVKTFRGKRISESAIEKRHQRKGSYVHILPWQREGRRGLGWNDVDVRPIRAWLVPWVACTVWACSIQKSEFQGFHLLSGNANIPNLLL